LSWSIKVGFISDVAMNVNSFLTWKFSAWLSVSINLAWSSLWIDVACPECSPTWYVVSVVVWMSLWESFSSIPSWSWIESIITWWNPFLIVMGWWQIESFTVKSIFGKNISALFCESLFEKRICSNHRSIALILGNHWVFLSDRFESVRHVIGRGSIHVTSSPLEAI